MSEETTIEIIENENNLEQNSKEIIKMLKTLIPSISVEYFIIVLKKCIDVSTYYDVKYLSVMHQWWNGRHVRLRGVWRDPCKFKSCLVHDSSANAELFLYFSYIFLMNYIQFLYSIKEFSKC